ncbi:AMP-dependent synthetase/ligase [Mycolicibacterium sp. 3033]|nr:AMP-dependent synthetase/ligase [Mycolicibacterium aurantiacum]
MLAPTPDAVKDARSLCELFQSTVAAHSDRVALRDSASGASLTWSQYGKRVQSVAAGLAALGVSRGDTVALMLTNRPEFNIVDAAAMHLGAVPFSVYETSPAAQVQHVFANAGNRIVLCEKQFLATAAHAAAGSSVDHIVCVDGDADGHDTLADMESRADPAFDFDAAWRAVHTDDLLTLIYTSGTTGPPKGVELTHANLQSNIAALLDIDCFDHTDRVLSYLPDAHIVNRYLAHYLPAVSGVEVTTVADRALLLRTLIAVRPTIFAAVPLFWYKIQAALQVALTTQTGLSGRLARWAVGAGVARARSVGANRRPPLGAPGTAILAEKLVLGRMRRRCGLDQVRIAVSGAAPVATETLHFMLGLGLPVCEAWGMSELSALATVNRPNDIRVGTVGTPITGVEVRVADDGELLVRSPGLMKRYRGEPALTTEAIDADGWLHTGDVGTVDEHGFVRIVDRKKELIINSGGKNISPSTIENHVRAASPLVGSVIAIGDERPFIVALVAIDADAAAALAGPDPDAATVARRVDVQTAIENAVTAANTKLSRVEQIKYVRVVSSFWELGGDELTPTGKLKRKPITIKYASDIDDMYASATKVATRQ